MQHVASKVCRTCQEEKTPYEYNVSTMNGKMYLSKVCKACKRKKTASKYKENGKIKQRHKTESEEKKKAFKRDKKCIHPSCYKTDGLDFHHAFSKPLDKLYHVEDMNKYYYGVMLCREHHNECKTNDDMYEYCKLYLREMYKNVVQPKLVPPSQNERNKFHKLMITL